MYLTTFPFLLYNRNNIISFLFQQNIPEFTIHTTLIPAELHLLVFVSGFSKSFHLLNIFAYEVINNTHWIDSFVAAFVAISQRAHSPYYFLTETLEKAKESVSEMMVGESLPYNHFIHAFFTTSQLHFSQ